MEMSAYHRPRPEVLYKVVLLGDYGVGKTSLFRRLRDGSFADGTTPWTTDATCAGLDKCTKTFRTVDGKSVMVSDSLLLLSLVPTLWERGQLLLVININLTMDNMSHVIYYP